MSSGCKKVVFVVGQESSGSRLVAKACAAAHGIAAFDDWNAIGWVHGDSVSVCHRSLPFGTPPRFPDIARWRRKYGTDHEIHFVLTTRDVTLSDISKMEVFGKSSRMVQEEREKARCIYEEIMGGDDPYFLFSYETLMFLKELYWRDLYRFLGVPPDSGFFPDLHDANARRISEMDCVQDEVPTQVGIRMRRTIRGSLRRLLDWFKGEAD